MNEQRFKTEYQRSENSVPVNMELKKKLIEMAKEYEKSESAAPEITISRTAQRKRIRRIITELSAIAACAALCAYTIPKIGDRYFDRTNENELIISTETTKPNDTEPEQSEDVPASVDAASVPQTDMPESGRSTSPTNTTTTSGITSPSHAVETGKSDVNTSAINGTAQQHEASVPYPSESNTSGQDRAIYSPSNGNTEYSKSDLDSRIGTIVKNNKKLENWNDALVPYISDDAIISGYYDSFSQSVSKYTAAADDFEKSYGSASDSGQIYEGIEKYDTELDGILFEACRADYRKAKNYIEMNLTDYITEEPEETNTPEESEVTEGAE